MSHQLRCHRDPSYLEFVRSRPCYITGQELGVVAHHVRCLGGGGTGLKPSDYMCVPLTSEEHAKLHHMGENSYWSHYEVDPSEAISMTLLVYFAQKRVDYVSLIRFLEGLT